MSNKPKFFKEAYLSARFGRRVCTFRSTRVCVSVGARAHTDRYAMTIKLL